MDRAIMTTIEEDFCFIDINEVDCEMFCVYLTIYSGTLMPKYYVGSTQIKNIKFKKYYGSVLSKTFKKIWKQELKDNKDKFDIKLLKICETRKQALNEELEIQKKYNVVTDANFINLSFAQKNGFFGLSVPKEQHPSYGKKWSEDRRLKYSEMLKSTGIRAGEKNSRFGKKASAETRKKQSEKRKEYLKSDRYIIPKRSPIGKCHYDNFVINQIIQLRDEEHKSAKEIVRILAKNNIIISDTHIKNLYKRHTQKLSWK